MRTWTETIQSNSGRILDEVLKMTDNLEKQGGSATRHGRNELQRRAGLDDRLSAAYIY
jgi:uncharacterized protein Yka (UPF0111/DUF47 family)